MLRAQTMTTCTSGILTPPGWSYQTTAELHLWRQNTHRFSVFLIESSQHVMLFLGSQNDPIHMFLFGNGYSSTGGNTVIINAKLLHWQHCHDSQVDNSYCVNGFRVDTYHDQAPVVFVVVVALFMVPVFIYFFSRVSKLICSSGLSVEFRV